MKTKQFCHEHCDEAVFRIHLFHTVAAWAGDLSYLIPVFVILVALIAFLIVRAQHRKKQ